MSTYIHVVVMALVVVSIPFHQNLSFIVMYIDFNTQKIGL